MHKYKYDPVKPTNNSSNNKQPRKSTFQLVFNVEILVDKMIWVNTFEHNNHPLIRTALTKKLYLFFDDVPEV